MAQHIVRGASLPRLLYGTAWRANRTGELVEKAIKSGFTGIVTGGEGRNYNEKLVGQAVSKTIKDGVTSREKLFIQTSFAVMSSAHEAENTALNYDSSAPIHKQVLQSVEQSLNNLQTDYIDALILSRPYRLSFDNEEVWGAFEELVASKKVRHIGISRVHDPEQLQQIYNNANVKPSIITNRFYADNNYDPEIRQFAKNKQITYQSFWTLTGNPQVTNQIKYLVPEGKTVQQLWYKFVTQLGIVPLTAPTTDDHFRQVSEVPDLPELSEEQFETIAAIARNNLPRGTTFP